MDMTTQSLTRYFRDIQERANLQRFTFSSEARFTSVPIEEIRSGTLEAETVAALVASLEKDKASKSDSASKSGKADRASKDKPIDVVISLVTLEGEKKEGLLLLPATVQPDGQVQYDLESTPPWIPAERLESGTRNNMELMVGSLSTFWSYRLATWPEAVSKVESWPDAVRASLAMFDAVAAPDIDSQATTVGADLVRNTCFISTEKVITANGAILSLYDVLLKSPVKVPAYQRLLSLTPPGKYDSDTLDDAPAVLANAATLSYGSMSATFALTESQRRAVHAFLLDGDHSPVTAVSGPPGTGKTTMLQSVVASLIVRHALDQQPAPVIVGTSTNNQAVTNIIDSFNSVSADDPGPVDHRWLPRADAAATEPLSGLAAYLPSAQRAEHARRQGYLVEDTQKCLYTAYSDPDYVAAATTFFLTRHNDFAASTGGVVRPAASLDEAISTLHAALTRIDDNRTVLINEKASAERHAKPARDRAAALAQDISSWEAERDICASRLQLWDAIYRQPNRNLASDPFIIEQNSDPTEPARRQQIPMTVVDYCRFYSYWVSEWTRQIDNARRALAGIAVSTAPTAGAQHAVKWLTHLGAVDGESAAALVHAPTLSELDKLLDTTVRYAEFWIAVHYYEAMWLKAVSGDELIDKDHRWRTTAEVMDRYWGQLPALTPCLVMTAYQLPKIFKLFKPGGINYDLNRADLLIIDESGQVDTSIAAATFALTQRALVVGDVQQLAPIWSIDPQSDSEIAALHGLEQRWPDMVKYGLTASDHSSVMAAASSASNWSYGPDHLPGLFLSEHFRCHPDIINYCNALLYNGLLKPSRPLDGYKLAGKVPRAFLFRTVDLSQDQRSGSSRVNVREATAIATWINENYAFFDEIYNADGARSDSVLAVVTPFAAQARLITNSIEAGLRGKITVGTAHTLQGAERPVVLFSAVYGDNTDKAGFVDKTLELMNVAVSRAKDLFIVFGAAARLKDNGPVFSLVRDFAEVNDCRFASAGHPTAAQYGQIARSAPQPATSPQTTQPPRNPPLPGR